MTIYKIEIITIEPLEEYHIEELKEQIKESLYADYNIWINILNVEKVFG